MNVGRNQILSAISELGANVEAVCARTGAGMTCGSCRPEVADLAARFSLPEAAE